MKIEPTVFNKAIKPGVFLLLLFPVLALTSAFYLDSLGANPVEYLLRSLGEWSLRLLLLALLLSPLSRILRWAQVLQLRRMTGLFSFFYATLHLLCYLGFEQGFSIQSVMNDIWERPFIAVGFAAFLTLLPLAATSTHKKIRQMGQYWKLLHRFVYLAVILCVVHFWLLVKADIKEPIVYTSLTTIVLLERVRHRSKNKK